MESTIFRQYDIRGKVGSELSLDKVYQLALAIAYYFKEKKPHINTVAVGADGRIHSPFIKQEVCRAFNDSGLNVIFIGVCPTPVLYFALYTLPVDAGVMITASHNGKEYNGMKICLGTESVWGQQLQDIKNLAFVGKSIIAEKKGTYTEHNLVQDYIDWLVNHFSHLKGNTIKAVIDSGNGAGGTVIPQLVKKMKWNNVTLLCQEVDGNYPNHEADPTVEKNMMDVRKAMIDDNLDIGIGLDGDCDRMACLTKKGELVQGDKLLALFAQKMINQNPKMNVVFDIKCSSGLNDLLEEWGAIPRMSPSGHSIIKEQIKKHNAILAGELSCHFSFKDRYFGYDDGIYALLRLVELLNESSADLDTLLTIFPQKYSTREIRLLCEEDQKELIVNALKEKLEKRSDATLITIDGIRVILPYGWGIVRSSNTQPVVCLRFESDTAEGLKKIKDDFVDLMSAYFNKQWLLQQING